MEEQGTLNSQVAGSMPVMSTKRCEKMNTVSAGDIGEAMAIADFTKAGFGISKPLSNNLRYDLIVDINNILYRVQVKTTSVIKDEKMMFSTKTTNYVKGKYSSNAYSSNEVDMFYLYHLENDWRGLYIVEKGEKIPVEMGMRLTPPKNGQTKGIKMAVDFEFSNQIEKFKDI